MIRTLELGSVAIPMHAALDLEQTYEDIGPTTILRMMDGAGVLQGTWSRLRTTISGSGAIPVGISGLDRYVQHTLKCVAERAIDSPSNAITLPVTRRTDAGYEPFGLAVMADQTIVQSPASLAGNALTITPVAGAIGYRATWWPQLTVWLLPWQERKDHMQAQTGWQITCEEI